MVVVQIGRGSNSTVDLTPQEELQARDLAQTSLENNSTIYFSKASFEGSEKVRQRASFLYADARARGFITARDSFYLSQGLKPVYSSGRIVGFEDLKNQQSIPVSQTPASPVASEQKQSISPTTPTFKQIIDKQIAEQNQPYLERRQVATSPQGVPVFKTFYIDPTVTSAGGVVREATASEVRSFRSQTNVLNEPIKEKGFLENAFNSITKKSEQVSKRGTFVTQKDLQPFVSGATSTGLGFLSSITGTALFGKKLVTEPITTTKSVGSSIVSIVKNPSVVGATAGSVIKSNPSFAFGFVAGEVAQFKGLGAITTKTIKPLASKVINPKAEQIVSIGLETNKGKTSGAIIGFETESGRIGQISQIGIKQSGGKQVTVAGGKIYDVKFKIGGERQLINPRSFVGEIDSISKSVKGQRLLFEGTPKGKLHINTVGITGGIESLPSIRAIGKPIRKTKEFGKIEGIAGKGRVAISRNEKLVQTIFEVQPKPSASIITRVKTKGIRTLDFESKSFAIDVGKAKVQGVGITDAKFLLGGISVGGKAPKGFSGFAFKLNKIKNPKGFSIQTPQKSFKILSSDEIGRLKLKTKVEKFKAQRQVELTSIAQASTTRTITPNIKGVSVPRPQGTITFQQPQASVSTFSIPSVQRTPSFSQSSIALTSTTPTIRPIQSSFTSGSFKLSSLPRLSVVSKPRARERLGAGLVVTPAFKQPQLNKLGQRTFQAQRQPARLKTRQVLKQRGQNTQPPVAFGLKTRTGIIPAKEQRFKTISSSKTPFLVSVRRGGVFRPIGRTRSVGEAITIGRTRTSRTLGASFKIKPLNTRLSGGIKTPRGFYRSKKDRGLVFIEKKQFRLSKAPEIKEIQIARRR